MRDEDGPGRRARIAAPGHAQDPTTGCARKPLGSPGAASISDSAADEEQGLDVRGDLAGWAMPARVDEKQQRARERDASAGRAQGRSGSR